MRLTVILALSVFSAFGQQPNQAVVALYRGDIATALQISQEYLRASPEKAAAHVLMARVQVARGEFEAAYGELCQAVRMEPQNTDALYYLSKVAEILSRAEHQRLFALAPESARVHELMAESLAAQNRETEAIEEYEAALRADPRSIEVLDALGDLERKSSHFDEALRLYLQAQAVNPRDFQSVYGAGACYLFQEETGKAIQEFRRALSIDSHSPAAHLALGLALLRGGHAAEAADEGRKTVVLEPSSPQPYILLGRAYRKLGQDKAASLATQKARALFLAETEASLIPPAEPR